MLYQTYFQKVQTMLSELVQRQQSNIIRAAEMVAECVGRGGILYAFGCGHSHMITEELFYRAGGMAPVSAILSEELMLHQGAVRGSAMERTEGISPRLFDEYGITPNDLLLVISTSGINAAPVEMVLKAKQNGVKVMCISSSAYAQEVPRHISGTRLSEIADLFLDNGVPLGDACIHVEEGQTSIGPVSTMLSTMLVNCIMVEAADYLQKQGIQLPVYSSGNVGEGALRNARLIDAYRDKIKLLDPR